MHIDDETGAKDDGVFRYRKSDAQKQCQRVPGHVSLPDSVARSVAKPARLSQIYYMEDGHTSGALDDSNESGDLAPVKEDGQSSPPTTEDVGEQHPDTETEQEVYSVFTKRQKALIVSVVAIAGSFRWGFLPRILGRRVGSPVSSLHTLSPITANM
jgi:hypothetical protein